MKTPFFPGIFNKSFDFLEEVLPESGEKKKKRIRSKASEGWYYI